MQANKENCAVSESEKKLLELIRSLGYGQVVITVKEGKPIQADEIRKTIKL